MKDEREPTLGPGVWDGPIDSGPDSGTYYWWLVFGDFRLQLRQMKDRPTHFWGAVNCGPIQALGGLRIDATEPEAAKKELVEKACGILVKALEELPAHE